MGVVLLPDPHKNHLGFVLDEKLNCHQYLQSKISKYDQPNGMIYNLYYFFFQKHRSRGSQVKSLQ